MCIRFGSDLNKKNVQDMQAIVRWKASPSWKTRNIFVTLWSNHISVFESGGGTVGQLTGSLLTNLMILETMLSSDFFSDLSLLSYKSVA